MTNDFLSDIDLILVAVVPKPNDLNIARLLGWYRIPLKSAPKVISVDYLAFYQTGAFGEIDRWKIQFVAPVQGYELTTRSELLKHELDHPRANEEYYKVQIGSLISLDKPITADQWRRVTFFYTTGEMLQNASSIRDLIVSGEERLILWNNLKERAETYSGGAQSFDDYEKWNIDLVTLLNDWDKIKEPDINYDKE
jgi:hypothetical protein